MPSPKLNTIIRRPDLGAIVMEMWENSLDAGFIGTTLYPSMPVREVSGVYPVIPKEALMKNVNPARAPKSAYIRTNYEYERGLYTTAEYGVEEVIDDVERELMDQEAAGAADRIAARRATGFLLRAQERRAAATLFSTDAVNRLTTALNPPTPVTNEWSDFANATPISDIKAQLNPFRKRCGALPHALVINWEVYNNLTQCQEIVDQIKYTFPGLNIRNLSEGQLAQVLGVPRLIVAGGLQDTAGFGLDASIGDIWSSEYAALVRISSGGITDGGMGKTMMWTRDAQGVVVEQYREEAVRGDVYRVRHYVGINRLASYEENGTTIVSDIWADNVHLFTNITAP